MADRLETTADRIEQCYVMPLLPYQLVWSWFAWSRIQFHFIVKCLKWF